MYLLCFFEILRLNFVLFRSVLGGATCTLAYKYIVRQLYVFHGTSLSLRSHDMNLNLLLTSRILKILGFKTVTLTFACRLLKQ